MDKRWTDKVRHGQTYIDGVKQLIEFAFTRSTKMRPQASWAGKVSVSLGYCYVILSPFTNIRCSGYFNMHHIRPKLSEQTHYKTCLYKPNSQRS